MLKVQISKKSQKFLKKLPAKQQNQIALKIRDLRQNDNGADNIHLKGNAWYRVDIGDYRIIYSIEVEELLIIPLVGKRNDGEVYKKTQQT